MTEFPARGRASWKKHQSQKKLKNLFLIFCLFLLLFGIFNGITKGFSFKKYLVNSKWKGNSTFSAVLTGNSPALLIFQQDPKRIALINFDNNYFLANSGIDNPVIKIADLINKDAEEITKILSVNSGVKLDNIVMLKNDIQFNSDKSIELFKKFASITTPIKIITGANVLGISETNLTRIDAFRLWWQIKGLGIEKVELVNIEPFSQEIVTDDNQKVLGIDDESLNRKISQFTENRKFSENDYKVVIKNASGNSQVSDLTVSFVSSLGLKVEKVEMESQWIPECKIEAKNKKSEAVNYLAKMFSCDIFALEVDSSEDLIMLSLGRNFAKKYFE